MQSQELNQAQIGETQVLTPNGQEITQTPPEQMEIAPARQERDYAAFKKAIKSGVSIYSSMISAGFPVSVAKMGIRRLPPKFLKVVTQERRRNIDLARQFTHDELKDYIVGGLISNTIEGEDKACKSFELLGKTKDLALFTPDSHTGVIVIQAAPIPSLPVTNTLSLPSVQPIESISAALVVADDTK